MKKVARYALIVFITALSEGIILGVYQAIYKGYTDWSSSIVGYIAFALVIRIWLYIIPVSVFIIINNRLQATKNQLFQQVVLGMVIAAITGCLSFPQLYRLNLLSALLCAPIGAIWGLLHWWFITRPLKVKE